MVLINKNGLASGEVRKLWKKTRVVDSLNLIKVRRILDEEGWLGTDVVGEKGNAALFLVIQHADRTAREQYRPMMAEAVKNKSASPADFALLEDRLALDQGKKQRYGSQIGFDEQKKRYYVLPIEDPDHVDDRRRKMGLDSMKIHVAKWGIIWG